MTTHVDGTGVALAGEATPPPPMARGLVQLAAGQRPEFEDDMIEPALAIAAAGHEGADRVSPVDAYDVDASGSSPWSVESQPSGGSGVRAPGNAARVVVRASTERDPEAGVAENQETVDIGAQARRSGLRAGASSQADPSDAESGDRVDEVRRGGELSAVSRPALPRGQDVAPAPHGGYAQADMRAQTNSREAGGDEHVHAQRVLEAMNGFRPEDFDTWTSAVDAWCESKRAPHPWNAVWQKVFSKIRAVDRFKRELQAAAEERGYASLEGLFAHVWAEREAVYGDEWRARANELGSQIRAYRDTLGGAVGTTATAVRAAESGARGASRAIALEAGEHAGPEVAIGGEPGRRGTFDR